ncbi:hypothetical protein ACOSP7_028110 [Xanthoceras sorbifolium]
MKLLLIIIWRVWYRRNRAMHSSSLLSAEETMQWVNNFLTEFRVANTIQKLQRSSPLVRWRVPSPGWFKINTDAALDFCSRRLGFGIVIRDLNGLVMVSSSMVFSGFFSLEIADVTIVLRGVRLALEMGFSPICIESDDASIV